MPVSHSAQYEPTRVDVWTVLKELPHRVGELLKHHESSRELGFDAHSGEADHRIRCQADHPVRSSRSPVGAKRRGGSIMPFSDRLGSMELSSFAWSLL